MSDLGQRLRKSAPLLICVGMIFPWSISPFGLQSCSVTTGSFLPESRSILRQWLPLEVKLDTRADHKEDPSKLEGLKGVKVYYFDPFVVLFVLNFLRYFIHHSSEASPGQSSHSPPSTPFISNGLMESNKDRSFLPS